MSVLGGFLGGGGRVHFGDTPQRTWRTEREVHSLPLPSPHFTYHTHIYPNRNHAKSRITFTLLGDIHTVINSIKQ